MKVYVLWWEYLDGSGSGVARVFADKGLAESTFALLADDSLKNWVLKEVKITGPVYGISPLVQLLDSLPDPSEKGGK